jgi:hypothetical protein
MLTIERWIVRTKGLPNPSADFSSMHSGGVGNVSTDAPTHAAMPHFLVHFIKFPFPVYCFSIACFIMLILTFYKVLSNGPDTMQIVALNMKGIFRIVKLTAMPTRIMKCQMMYEHCNIFF